MQVKVTLTLKEEELKKIMDETGLTKPDEIKGYFYARERRNIDCEFGRRYNIDVKVDDTDDKLKQLGETLSGFFGICTELPVATPIEKPEVKEVKRKAKVGEWIKITGPVCGYNGKKYYEEGDIFKVYKLTGDGLGFLFGGVYCELEKKVPKSEQSDVSRDSNVVDNGNLVIWNTEYVVLENYEPEDGENK